MLLCGFGFDVVADQQEVNKIEYKFMNKGKPKNAKGKELRKPISNNFAPKRLAVNFDPPMLIMEYLVVDTGKLYHHKMRLDSVLRKQKLTREDVLNYVKTKHHLYFVSGKVKDAQLLKFIDKLLVRKGIISKADMANLQSVPVSAPKQPTHDDDDDFDYLNDDEEYEEDYEDYEDPSNFVDTKKKEEPKEPQKKNAFLAYCQEYEDGQGEQAQASWDLDMDENDDFV